MRNEKIKMKNKKGSQNWELGADCWVFFVLVYKFYLMFL